MALIDVLPKFVHKPVDLGKYTRLSPRPGKEDIETSVVTQPAPAVQTTSTPADAQRSGAISVAPPEAVTITSPEAPSAARTVAASYKRYDPVLQSLTKAGITNDDAKAAIVAQLRQEGRINDDNARDFNYGNITKGSSWTGPTVRRRDTDATGKPIWQDFRVYSSADEYVNNYLDTLKKVYPRAYAQVTGNSFDISQFMSGLVDQPRKYATDPRYKELVTKLYNQVRTQLYETNT